MVCVLRSPLPRRDRSLQGSKLPKYVSCRSFARFLDSVVGALCQGRTWRKKGFS